MEWRDRQGNPVPGDDTQNKTLRFLYETAPGRRIVSLLIRPRISRAAGAVMDSGLSRAAIRPFLKKNRINMDEYEARKFRSFNDFFTRKIREEARPVDGESAHLISPCDCKLSVFPITRDAAFRIKGMDYTMESLLRDEALARRYEGGTFLLFRLTVGDYHRYSYVDSGTKGENVRIPGVYHTVNPIACQRCPVYRENTREYSILESENFGPILMMEVGATMVGRIVNYHGPRQVRRGEEKGRFEFGGSTVILCLEKDRAIIDGDLLRNTEDGAETVVRLGERIGCARN